MKNKKVLFVAKHKEMLDLDYALPQPAENFIPDWFNKVPNYRVDENRILLKRATTKSCPSFSDTFKEGFIIPAPCDIWLKVEEDGSWAWEASNGYVQCEIHHNDTMVNYLPKSSNVRQVFKLMLPFTIHTPKGVWIRQVPMFWNYNSDFHIPYGQFNTNKVHQVNLQILYTSDKNEILIKQGTPLGQYVPFRKEKFNIKLIKPNDKYKHKEGTYIWAVTSRFKGGYYHNLRD